MSILTAERMTEHPAMDFEIFTRVKRKMGRRWGGDRRCFEYAMVIPERRMGERRTISRRKAFTGQFNGR